MRAPPGDDGWAIERVAATGWDSARWMKRPFRPPPRPTQICPWCSATVKAGPAPARLRRDPDRRGDDWVPGITEIDPKVARGERPPPQRSRLLSWISGDYPDTGGGPVDPGALAPPDPAVQREILLLELQAEVANLQAEADAMRADAIVEGRVADAEEIADAEEEAGIPAAEAEAGLHAGAAAGAAAAAPDKDARRPPTPDAAAVSTADAAVSCGGARSPATARSVLPPRAADPHRRPHAARRHGPADRSARRLVAGRRVGRRRRGRRELPRRRADRGAAARSAAGAPRTGRQRRPVRAHPRGCRAAPDAARPHRPARRSEPAVAGAPGHPRRVPVRARAGGHDGPERARRDGPGGLRAGHRRAPPADDPIRPGRLRTRCATCSTTSWKSCASARPSHAAKRPARQARSRRSGRRRGAGRNGR